MDKQTKKEFDNLAGMIKRGFDRVDERFDKIEKLMLADHKRRIEQLEHEVKNLKELLAIK